MNFFTGNKSKQKIVIQKIWFGALVALDASSEVPRVKGGDPWLPCFLPLLRDLLPVREGMEGGRERVLVIHETSRLCVFRPSARPVSRIEVCVGEGPHVDPRAIRGGGQRVGGRLLRELCRIFLGFPFYFLR